MPQSKQVCSNKSNQDPPKDKFIACATIIGTAIPAYFEVHAVNNEQELWYGQHTIDC